jgi:hypothetical protein
VLCDGETINNVFRYWTGHLSFVEQTIGSVIEEYTVDLPEKEHVTFIKLVGLCDAWHTVGDQFPGVLAAFRQRLGRGRRSQQGNRK